MKLLVCPNCGVVYLDKYVGSRCTSKYCEGLAFAHPLEVLRLEGFSFTSSKPLPVEIVEDK